MRILSPAKVVAAMREKARQVALRVPEAMLIEVLPPSGEVAETNSAILPSPAARRDADPGLAGTQPDGHPTQRFPEVRRRQR